MGKYSTSLYASPSLVHDGVTVVVRDGINLKHLALETAQYRIGACEPASFAFLVCHFLQLIQNAVVFKLVLDQVWLLH